MKKIKLTKGYYALVDDEDFERVNRYHWQCIIQDNRLREVCGRVNGIMTKLHRFILNAQKGKEVDHKDRNILNNQKSNLRICTHQENCINRGRRRGSSSRYKGVYWDSESKKWRVEIEKNGVRIGLGRFKNEIDAASAYNNKARELHGEFACINILK